MGCNEGCGSDGFTKEDGGERNKFHGRDSGGYGAAKQLASTDGATEQCIIHDRAGNACGSGCYASSDGELSMHAVSCRM